LQYLRHFLLAAALCAAPLAQAETTTDEGWFFGIGGALITFDDDIDEYDPVNGYLRGGYTFNRYLDLGVEFSGSLSPDESGPTLYDVATGLLFLRGKLPLDDDSSLYAMVGASRVKLSATAFGVDTNNSDNGVGFGFGFEHRITKTEFFAIDYMIYYDDNEFDDIPTDVTVDSLNFGFYGYF